MLKPAALTPLSSLILGELAREAGAPAGCPDRDHQQRPGSGHLRCWRTPGLRKLSFTGSTPVGRLLLQQSGASGAAHLDGAGRRSDGPGLRRGRLDLAVSEAMIAKMHLGGPSCVGANRFLVQEPIADAFAAAMAERMAATRVGPPDRETPSSARWPTTGRWTRSATSSRTPWPGCRRLAEAAIPDGPGHYAAPTVLDHVPADAAIMHEEVFGPVAAIHRFSTEAEAIAIANNTEHGLASYLMTSQHRPRPPGRRPSAGRNGRHQPRPGLDVAAPFGGVKQSGLGREGGPEGLHEYQQLKYLSMPGFQQLSKPTLAELSPPSCRATQ